MNDLCQKWKGKLIFFEASTGCQEPVMLSVWKSLTYGVIFCNSLMAWPDWSTPL